MRRLVPYSIAAILAALAAAGCQRVSNADAHRPADVQAFPLPDRPVSRLAATAFSTEIKRDAAGEFRKLVVFAQVRPGMTVADLGAGDGYDTVRLAPLVGVHGRVLAEDINRDALNRLGDRVARERLDNVSIKLGLPQDPRLPTGSFDRIFLVHMYHEVDEPFAFLWYMRPALAPDGQVIVVDADRPTDRHGIPPRLLACEFRQVGFRMTGYARHPELGGYFARFVPVGPRPDAAAIRACRNTR